MQSSSYSFSLCWNCTAVLLDPSISSWVVWLLLLLLRLLLFSRILGFACTATQIIKITCEIKLRDSKVPHTHNNEMNSLFFFFLPKTINCKSIQYSFRNERINLINNEPINEHSSRTKMKIIKIKVKREQSSRHFIQCLWFLLQLDYAQHDKIKLEFRPASLHRRLDSSDFKTTKIITSLEDWTEKEENRSQEMNTPNEEIRTKRMRARWSGHRQIVQMMPYVSAQKRILDVRVNVSWLHPDNRIILHTNNEKKCVRRRSQQSQTFTRTRQSGLETKAKQKQCRSGLLLSKK